MPRSVACRFCGYPSPAKRKTCKPRDPEACDHPRMQLLGDRIVAPKMLMIREIMVNNSCHFITLDQALFVRKGETLRLDGLQPVVERLDGTVARPGASYCTVKWAFKLL
ncbi:hypothetical protein GCM10009682_31560 [Luedemannella flava]|uniref:Uncharacterized protein n=2 Tax=Luedemannella flava TaxID=349316 RepID=A0ABN2M335_9ACTN